VDLGLTRPQKLAHGVRVDIHASSPIVLSMRGCVEKNLSPISVRDKATIEYICGRKPSLYELTFRVELGPNIYF